MVITSEAVDINDIIWRIRGSVGESLKPQVDV